MIRYSLAGHSIFHIKLGDSKTPVGVTYVTNDPLYGVDKWIAHAYDKYENVIFKGDSKEEASEQLVKFLQTVYYEV